MVIVVFDMDGVLADTVELMFESVNSALITMKKNPITFAQFSKSYNPRDWKSTLEGFGIDFEKEAQEFKEIYLSFKLKKLGTLIPPKNFFEFLHRKVEKLYILSAGNEDEVMGFLNEAGIVEDFDEILFDKSRKTDTLVEICRDNSNDKVYFIGDSISDIMCTKDARGQVNNIYFIGIVHRKIGISMGVQRSVSSKKDFEKLLDNGDIVIENLTEMFRKVPDLRI